MKTVMCIPTYNNPLFLSELLTDRAETYCQHEIDIIFFDSSEDSASEKIVREYAADHDNVAYKRLDDELNEVPVSMQSNTKAYYILKHFSEPSDERYEYLWICSDALRFSDEALDRIDSYISAGKYDYIMLNSHEEQYRGDRLYPKPADFIKDNAWWMTWYGTTIVRIDTVLAGVDWDYYFDRYLRESSYNYSHLAFYAERTFMLNSFSAVSIDIWPGGLMISENKIGSGWINDVFHILFDVWPHVINMLSDKLDCTKETTDNMYRYSHSFTFEQLYHLRACGKFTNEVYEAHKEWIQIMVRKGDVEIRKVLALEPDVISERLIRIWDNFMKFYDNHDSIVIYGAGYFARIYAALFNQKGLAFRGFIVSNTADNPTELMGKPVTEVDQTDFCAEKTGIVLGISEPYIEEVKATLDMAGVRADVFSDRLEWVC